MFLYILYRLYKGTGCFMPLVDVQSPSFQAVYISLHYTKSHSQCRFRASLAEFPNYKSHLVSWVVPNHLHISSVLRQPTVLAEPIWK